MTNNSRKEHWIENDLLSSVSVLSQMRWELSKGKEIVNFPAHSITVRLWLVKLEKFISLKTVQEYGKSEKCIFYIFTEYLVIFTNKCRRNHCCVYLDIFTLECDGTF